MVTSRLGVGGGWTNLLLSWDQSWSWPRYYVVEVAAVAPVVEWAAVLGPELKPPAPAPAPVSLLLIRVLALMQSGDGMRRPYRA